MTIIQTVEELREIYECPSEASVIKVTASLTPEYQRMIESAPFLALATVGPEGLDCSPRGDKGGVVRVEDKNTILLPDWRGNNRVDSLVNIVRGSRVALMFLVPGSNITMRINGHAVISIDPELLASFKMDGKHPRSVLIITIGGVYFQCARALMRSELWNSDGFVDAQSLPTAGDMLKAAKMDFDKETYDRDWAERAVRTIW